MSNQPPVPGPSGPVNPFGDLPPGSPPRYPNPHQPSPYAPQYAPQYHPAGTDPALGFVIPIGQSLWAVAAGYLGLLSLGICFLGPIAILCGAVGILDINRHPGRGGMFRCVVGITLGLLGSIGLAMMFVALTMSDRR